MKSKLSKQQKKYIKACDSKELRKELKRFFILQNILSKIESTPIIFEDGKFTTNNSSIIQHLNNHPMFSSQNKEEFEKTNGKGIVLYEINLKEFEEKFNENINKNSLTKETIESLTNPDLIEKSKEFNSAIDEHLEKEEILNKTDSNEIPMEFCVKITEDNFSVLNKIFLEYTTRWGGLISGRFLHTNTFSNPMYFTSNNLNATKNEVPIVSTEEFIRYIGKESLIPKKQNEKTILEFDLPKEIHKDENEFPPFIHLHILENGKRFAFTDDQFVKHNDSNHIHFGPLNKKQIDWLSNHKYSEEDMEKCFNESRLTHPIIGFKHTNFAEYLKSIEH